MAIARSKITAQGQNIDPRGRATKARSRPGSIVEWDDEGSKIVVRRAGRFTSEDIHRALFGARAPKERGLAELKSGIRDYVRKRHARG